MKQLLNILDVAIQYIQANIYRNPEACKDGNFPVNEVKEVSRTGAEWQ